MSCSPIPIKDYVMEELAEPERRKLEAHLKSCPQCREELDRLRLTEAALFSLRDEEIPQRIAFVSDPVFEPSPWRRWWSGLWTSPARLGFAAAAMLSSAILVSAFTRPATLVVNSHPAPAPVQTIAATQSAPASPALSDAEMERRIQMAVDKAVGASHEKEMVKVRQLVDDLEQQGKQLKLAMAELDVYQRRAESVRLMAYETPRSTPGGQQ
jgi:anti-sigma factor RsiW